MFSLHFCCCQCCVPILSLYEGIVSFSSLICFRKFTGDLWSSHNSRSVRVTEIVARGVGLTIKQMMLVWKNAFYQNYHWKWNNVYRRKSDFSAFFLLTVSNWKEDILKKKKCSNIWRVKISRTCTVIQVPYLPSCKDQTRNVMTLLEGRRGRLADLGSGDGRLVSDTSKFYVFYCVTEIKVRT